MHTHRIRTPLIGVLIVLVTIIGMVGASASGLGLFASPLKAFRLSGVTAAPPKISCDNFTGNGTMSGRSVRNASTCGTATWAIHRGSATTNGGQARPNGTNAAITVATGGLDRTAQVVVSNAGGGSDIAGLALAHNGSSGTPRHLAVALVGSGTVQLRLVNGTSVTTISSASATITGNTLLRARLSGGVVTVWVNGSQRLNTTLTSTQRSTIAAGSRYGIYDSGGSGRYDDFLVTQVWP